MKFSLSFETDNSAFENENLFPEIKRILEVAAFKVGNRNTEGRILDANGNSVGEFKLEKEGV